MANLNRRRMMLGAASLAGGATLATTIGGRASADALPSNAVGTVDGAGVNSMFPAVTVQPSDARYGQLVLGNNQRWQAQPDSVRLVSTASQALQVVQEAVSNGKRITVRGGGHCYEDFVSNSDVKIILDMSRMSEIYWDPAMMAYAVESGALLLDVYEKLFKVWGVTIPAGYCYSVGVGGHIAGGGYGLLGRRNGLTVDYLYAVEVVTVDATGTAKLVVATRDPNDPNRELWWAHTGGGGGSFGVVTRYWFRSPTSTPPTSATDPTTLLPAPPAQVLLSTVVLPWSSLTQADFTTLVRNYTAWYAANSAPNSPYTALGSYLILNSSASGAVTILAQVDATVSGAQQLLSSFLSAVTAGVAATPSPIPAPRTLPWLRATRMLGTSSPVLTNPTLRGDHKSAYYAAQIPDAQIATLYKYLTLSSYSNPNANVVLQPYGGQIGAAASGDTAMPHRSAILILLMQAFWTDAVDDPTHVGWVRAFYSELYGATAECRCPTASPTGATSTTPTAI